MTAELPRSWALVFRMAEAHGRHTVAMRGRLYEAQRRGVVVEVFGDWKSADRFCRVMNMRDALEAAGVSLG